MEREPQPEREVEELEAAGGRARAARSRTPGTRPRRRPARGRRRSPRSRRSPRRSSSRPMAEETNDVTQGDGYAVGNLDAMGEGPGFRKVRRELDVSEFGVNAIVMPAGYETASHYHDEQEELYFVHSGTLQFTFGDGRAVHARPGRPRARGCLHAPARSRTWATTTRSTCAWARRAATSAATGRPSTAEARVRLLGLTAVRCPARGRSPPRQARPLPGAPKCPIFPRTSHWNKRADKLRATPALGAMVAAVGADRTRACRLRIGALRRRADRHPVQGRVAGASGGCR